MPEVSAWESRRHWSSEPASVAFTRKREVNENYRRLAALLIASPR